MARLSLRTALALALVAFVARPLLAGDKPAYPPTRKVDAKDVLHGIEIPDPYRWLEDDESPEVEAWDRAQSAQLRSRLDACPGRGALEKRLLQELDLGGIGSLPRFGGDVMFFTYAAPGANHAALYVGDPAQRASARKVIDPNVWSSDGTQGMKEWWPSPDGRLVAYAKDSKGSEDTTLYVREVATGSDLPDVVTRTKFSAVLWRSDGRSFYYTRQPAADDVPQGEAQYHRRVRLHVLGTSVVDDPLIYGAGRPKIESMWVGASTDERHRFVVRGIPYETLDTFEIDETWGAPRLEPVLVGNDSRTYVDRVGELYIFNTDFQAPRRRVCVAQRGRTANPADWKEIVPESEAVLENVLLVKDRLVIHRRADLIARLDVVGLDGAALGEVALPGLGTVRDVSVKPNDARLWFTFESYSVPYSTWVVELGTPKASASTRYTPTRIETLPTTVAVENLVSERVDLPSKDGTKIPVFLLRHKNTPLDGSAPTVLYGYGGFRVGQYPGFSRSWALWAEQGGVYAAASLRGGDEYGEEWHAAGCLGQKQNVFDDMIACADGLVAQGKAKRAKLAIMGGSNGGLLVAVVANQRPDLCRAVVCSVPLIDMLRYHRFQYALSWTKEYGDPDVKEHFDWIRPYSPYHNVKDGTAYPAAFVTAGLKDGRVNAYHARKIVARWQDATSSAHPIMLYLDRESGHGSSSLLQAKRIILDRFCFLRTELAGP